MDRQALILTFLLGVASGMVISVIIATAYLVSVGYLPI